jgi:hypothetical protein
MPATFTPLLAEGRPARLDLGLAGASGCRVTGFAGSQVFLSVDDALFAEGDMQPGYLLVDDGGEHLQAMRGRVARLAEGAAVMHLTDDFSGQRRMFSRAPLVLPATVHAESGAEWPTFTRDISAGGVAIARQSAWDGAERFEITLRIGAELRSRAEVELRRASALTLGLSFAHIDPEHRAVLAELALAYHRA